MIDALTNGTALPALERVLQFSGARHRLIANNIANLSTPGFQPKDVSIAGFQEALGRAITERDESEPRRANAALVIPTRTAATRGGTLALENTSQITFERDRIRLNPAATHDNILFHDGNDRNLERIMQQLVENFMVFRQASELIRHRYEILNTAIRERI